ncbi:T9SS type A sorting domain-containing protein, partial [Flavobacterium sp.]|uniref:T9SS type A sorting domain-containing protein n=1 Tax=Flavobacterium sp. TaxID=239 RepID=UPI0039193A59
ITPSTSNTTTASACDTYTWSVNGATYTASGTYTSVVDCHTETLNLTITPSTSNTTTASACDTYTWSVNGATYTASGTYTSVVDCHTETLNLTITPSTSNTTTASACDTYTWSVNGATYTASGTYTSVVDCHTETLNLTITPSTSNTTTASACDTYTWSVNGATYTASGTYTSVVDCHTETLNLTITPSTSNTTTASACDTYTWSVNGATYTASGTYTSLVDCHTETLNLTINSAATPTGSSTQTVSVNDLNEATLEDLVVSPTTVIWYASLADAQNQVNPLAVTTVLTDGATYYAVNVSSGCPSLPFAVTVTVALGVNGFDDANFMVYPNPTSGMFNIKYTENISTVVLMNVLGQVILEEKPNFEEVTIDLSSLPSATYFVKVESNGKVKVVKVIKKD